MVKKKTNSRISEKKPGRLKIGVRVSLFNIHHLRIFAFPLQAIFECMIYSVCIFHDRHALAFSLRKLPEQVLKKVIPVNVIHISDQMPGGIKTVVMVVFRNRTGHQVIILKITIKKPCHCGNIPDHA